MAKALGIALKVVGWLLLALFLLWCWSDYESQGHETKVERLLFGIALVSGWFGWHICKLLAELSGQLAVLINRK